MTGEAQAWRFRDRLHAGERLAALLERYRADQPIVAALPRGGVVLGHEVARRLSAPLEVVVARRLDVPGHRELGLGAIGEEGIRVIDRLAARLFRVTDAQVENLVANEQVELERRLRVYRDGRPPMDVAGRTVLLVDDGLASGLTARAALSALARRGAGRCVLAVPVSAPWAAAAVRTLFDDVVTVQQPEDFRVVSLCYDDFDQVPEEHVLALLDHARCGWVGPTPTAPADALGETVFVPAGGVTLGATLGVPAAARGVVLVAHGAGSNRRSPRNQIVAAALQASGFGTLLLDLLTGPERAVDDRTSELRFSLDLLAARIGDATEWLATRTALPVGYLGSSTGAAAMMLAAAASPHAVTSIVCRGGRLDLVDDVLPRVRARTLLVVGAADSEVLRWNRAALVRLEGARPHLELVDGASHAFEEPGAIEELARLAVAWFGGRSGDPPSRP